MPEPPPVTTATSPANSPAARVGDSSPCGAESGEVSLLVVLMGFDSFGGPEIDSDRAGK